MANEVYANNNEIACKAAAGKSICAFPDVCMTPPENPATPPGVPVPYPNTGLASDTTDGSRTVQISGKEIMLKNKSYFKTSYGDEAGCAAKKGVLTSTNRGKVYFIVWSMDVKIEGENTDRHLDLTTHNHASPMANESAPQCYADLAAYGNPPGCEEQTKEARAACLNDPEHPPKFVKKGERKHRVECSDRCKEAMKCILVPKGKDKEMCCSPANTGDHLVEDHWVRQKDESGKKVPLPDFTHIADKPGGAYDGAPTLCVEGSRFRKDHGVGHGTRGVHEDECIGEPLPYGKAKEIALESHRDMTGEKDCGGCIEAQLDKFYGEDPMKECHTPDRKQSLTADQREQAEARKRPLKWGT
jgi:hypothetical protein